MGEAVADAVADAVAVTVAVGGGVAHQTADAPLYALRALQLAGAESVATHAPATAVKPGRQTAAVGIGTQRDEDALTA